MINNNLLKTDRLLLRPISEDDLIPMFKCVSNPSISKYMSWNPHNSKEETLILIKRLKNDMSHDISYTWSILYKDTFCGIFSLIDVKRTHRALTYNRAELAYWLDPKFQKIGIMTETGNQIIRFAFKKLNIHRLIVSHVSQNQSSKNLIKRLGFRYIGEEHEAFNKEGIWYNHKLYELLKNKKS